MNIMINNRFYTGSSAVKSRRKIIKNIKRSKLQLGIFVITLSETEGEHLDIYPSYVLLQPHFKDKSLNIVAIAKGKDEAYKLIEQIAVDCYKEKGDYNLKEFFQ